MIFGSMLMIGAIVGLVIAWQLKSIRTDLGSSDPETGTAISEDALKGVVVVQTAKERCTVAQIDNGTGQTTAVLRHCENNVRVDSHGSPIPVGTMRRLDSISKSFFGTDR
jgi:hypothetical protein